MVKLNGEDLEKGEFKYLGSKVSTNGSIIREVRTRKAKAAVVFYSLTGEKNCRKTKLSLFRSNILMVLTYGSESWC